MMTNFSMLFFNKVNPIKLLISMGRSMAEEQENSNITIELKHSLFEDENTDNY